MKIQTDALRAERLALGLSQKALADSAKVGRNTVISMERGVAIRMATIEKVAGALGLDPLDIAVGESDVERQALARMRQMQEAS